jgi:ubiquinone/menaquinone biosynthesis C-methylase UbiE
MGRVTDQKYLWEKQYWNTDRLNARAYLQQQYSTNSYSWWSWIFDHFRLMEDSRILELGCGPGFLWVGNRERIGRKWQVTLSDLTPGMVKTAREKLKTDADIFTYTVLDAQHIPFEDNVFDAVIANHMLYHVPVLDKAISEIKRVLRPGGKIYATTIGKNHMDEMKRWRKQFYPQPKEMDWGCIADRFGLENGEEILSRQFSKVKRWLYQDSLEVIEAEPVIAYIRSFIYDNAGENVDAKFRTYLERRIATDGALHITKDSGLFEAELAE